MATRSEQERPMSTSTPRTRRLAISLKGLLLLVLIVGALLAWPINRAREQRRLVKRLPRPGVTLHYDWEFVAAKYTRGSGPPGPRWLRTWLGDEYFQEIVSVDIAETQDHTAALERALDYLRDLDRLRELHINAHSLQDAHMARVAALTRLESLEIGGPNHLTSAGHAHIRSLGNLRSIAINDCAITDVWLDDLATLPSLEVLDVRGNCLTDSALRGLWRLPHLRQLRLGYGRNEITDRGMESLRRIQNLEVVDLAFTKVGDEGLRWLEGMHNLKEIRIGKSDVTPAGIARFQRRTVGVRIVP
jgi:Leucine rich repeat/Leucine Rich repeat